MSDGNVSAVVANDGTLSIYSRAGGSAHLNLTYLPAAGGWSIFDVTTQVGTPALD